MQAVDDDEVLAFKTGRLNPPRQVYPGIWIIPLALPGTLVSSSLAYLLVDDDRQGTIIDPGWDSEENWGRLQQGVTEAGLAMSDITQIIGTHLHPDHLGAAPRLRAATGGKLILMDLEQQAVDTVAAAFGDRAAKLETQLDGWGVPDALRDRARPAVHDMLAPVVVRADVLATDRLRLPFVGDHLEVIHTPGHTWGHICIALHDRKLIFTGDHILPGILSALGIGGPGFGNPLHAYLATLNGFGRFDGYVACPGHGYRFSGLDARVADIQLRHNRRSHEVAAILTDNRDQSVWEVAAQVQWSAGFDNLKGSHLVSALTQTALHIERVCDEGWPDQHVTPITAGV